MFDQSPLSLSVVASLTPFVVVHHCDDPVLAFLLGGRVRIVRSEKVDQEIVLGLGVATDLLKSRVGFAQV